MKPTDLFTPLTDAELDELDEVLGAVSTHSMGIHELDGYLCALVAGSETVSPSEFLPLIWERAADDDAVFADEATATETVGRILRHMNTIIAAVDRQGFYEPLFDQFEDRPFPFGHFWAKGFMRGVHLRNEAWTPLIRDEEQGGLLFTIATVSGEVDPGWLARQRTDEEVDRLLVDMAAGFLHAYQYFLPLRRTAGVSTTQVRATPKVGRNAPCPCGSGRKFKHCCGRKDDN